MRDPDAYCNVGELLTVTAEEMPEAIAVAVPRGRGSAGQRRYDRWTFRELDEDSTRVAAALRQQGAQPGDRLVLMVRPGFDFISLVFALFKAGVVAVLIDPGMGRRNLLACLAEVAPRGFVAIPLAQAVRCLLRRRFPEARLNVTVGRRWFWGGPTLQALRRRTPATSWTPATQADDAAAIIFTTGSTGPPKGVLYRHRNFIHQAVQLRDAYQIQPGEVDLPCFPLFALFNCAMGVTTVIPDMDPTRPADVDPRKICEPLNDWRATQAFGSPALWNTVGRYGEEHQLRFPHLKRVLSAGAPVPTHVLRRVKNMLAEGAEIFTPYGATEALPVASISGGEVLEETAARSDQGAGTCVGRKFSGIEWRVIEISDRPIATLDDARELPPGAIGELIVSGPVVTSAYVTRTAANADHKIDDRGRTWHRMGDVGYLDEQQRFWFCGRKTHRVQTAAGPMFTVPCEAIINTHPAVYRSALVGLGEPPDQRPVMVVETWPEHRPASAADEERLLAELAQLARQTERTRPIERFLLHPKLPTDIRHNSKIFREQLAPWAAKQLAAT